MPFKPTQTELPTELPLIAAHGAIPVGVKTFPLFKAHRKARRARCKARFSQRLRKQMDEAHALNTLGALARIAD